MKGNPYLSQHQVCLTVLLKAIRVKRALVWAFQLSKKYAGYIIGISTITTWMIYISFRFVLKKPLYIYYKIFRIKYYSPFDFPNLSNSTTPALVAQSLYILVSSITF